MFDVRMDLEALGGVSQQNPECTFIFGDFNCSPWDMLFNHPDGLITTPIILSSDHKRKINNDSYNCYYNPSWNLLGNHRNEFSRVPSYEYGSQIGEPRHRLFDQLLMPLPAEKLFVPESLCIINQINTDIHLWKEKLLGPTSGYSDHLPLFFQIRLKS